MKAKRVIAKNLLKFGAFFLLFSCSDATETESTPTVGPTTAIETDTSKIEAILDSLTQSVNTQKHLGIITFKGSPVALGDGYVKSWFSINLKTRLPEALGVELSKTALNNLPSPPAGDHTSLTYVTLDPIAKILTPYNHFAIGWESVGHLAPPPYGTTFLVPHFDLHLFTIPYEEQQAIASWDETIAPDVPTNSYFNDFPPPCFLPSNYYIVPLEINPAGGSYGKIGKHWVPTTTVPVPPFTYNVVYGTYKGKVNFIEIKAAHSSLSEQLNYEGAISQPLKFQKTRFYPTRYKIAHDNATDKIYITLTHFVLRKASQNCN